MMGTDELFEQIVRAVQFSSQSHAGQSRSGGEPYFNHPARVARLVQPYVDDTEIGASVIAAAYLHDVMEDCGVAEETLHAEGFWSSTILLVKELTDDPSWKRDERKQHQALKMEKTRFPDACLIKVCDQIDNLASLQVLLKKSHEDALQNTYTIARNNVSVVARCMRYLDGSKLVVDACIQRRDVIPIELQQTYRSVSDALRASVGPMCWVPVQGGGQRGHGYPDGIMSWEEHLVVYEAYAAKYGREQSPMRIAERGGFGKEEAEKLIGRPLTSWKSVPR